jgi:hypothetical protein
VLVAVFGILAVLVLEFGSFRSMLIVAGVIPLGMAGGFIALFLAGYDLSFTATIGIVALIGIEIKNSILLVDFTNQLREQGVPLDDAITQAGEIRFLPILLTSATAIGGLLPLAIQGSGRDRDHWRPAVVDTARPAGHTRDVQDAAAVDRGPARSQGRCFAGRHAGGLKGVRSGSSLGERKGRHARPGKTRNERLLDRAWANSRQSSRIRTAHAMSRRPYRVTVCR